MRRSIVGSIAALVLFAGVGEVAAQQTGTPIFRAPYRAFTTHEFGGSLSDPEGADFALEGFYRYGRGPHDFGLRAGFADFAADATGILIGADFRTQVLSYSPDFPLDGSLTVGLGGILGEDVDDTFLLPVGISLGRRFDLEGSNTSFVPYAHPVIVPVFGGDDDDVEFALGLGVDIRFSRDFAIRASGGIGDIEGVGISVAYVR